MIYKKIFKIISIISNIKIYFFKPSKSNILVYDRHSKLFAKAIFKKKKYIFFDTRWESINIQILILSLFKCKSFNFFEIKRNYKLLFFQIISPKIVYTSIDNNPGFYKLKELYPKAIYISDQNGIRHNDFYNYSKNYYRKERKKLQCDYFFVLGLNYYLKISKYVKAKYIVGGNTLNNEYPKKKFKKKKKSILYICGGYPNYEMELLSIKYLISFCTKYSYKLFILSKNDKKKDKMLIKKYGYMNLKIINNKKRMQNYEVMSKFSIIVFHYSTLGYEAISRGLKAISVGHKSFYSIKNNGPFWCSFNYKSIERLIIRVLKLSYFKWSKTHKKYSYNFMDYDPNNNKRKKIIYNCLFSKQLK